MNNNNWIDVKTRLPENNQKVTTKDSLGREFNCTFYCHKNRGNRPHFKVNGYVWEHDNVISWKPPKQKDSE
jgi:hypothetical protein